jgi:hypothetical protein
MLERWRTAGHAQQVRAADRRKAFADDLHGCHQRSVRAGVAGELAIQPYALDGPDLHHTFPPIIPFQLMSGLRNAKGSGNSPRTQVRNSHDSRRAPRPYEAGYARRLPMDHPHRHAPPLCCGQVLLPDVSGTDETCARPCSGRGYALTVPSHRRDDSERDNEGDQIARPPGVKTPEPQATTIKQRRLFSLITTPSTARAFGGFPFRSISTGRKSDH